MPSNKLSISFNLSYYAYELIHSLEFIQEVVGQ